MFLVNHVVFVSFLLTFLAKSGGVGLMTPTILNPNAGEVVDICKFAATKIDDSTLVKCLSASRLLVSGWEYEVSLLIAGPGALPPRICNARVFDQPWTSTRALVGYNCEL